jgi:putative transposase
MKQEKRELAFQDESAVRLLPSRARTYSLKGQTPQLNCDSKNRQYVSISGVITLTGKSYFEVRQMEGFKQKGLTRFLDNMNKKIRKKLLLIWNNAPSHKSQTVKDYLHAQNGQQPKIWMENIPPYSPELNPIEQVWAYLKKKLSNQFFEDTTTLCKAVEEELKKISQNKKLIIRFFNHKDLECYQFFN